MSSQSRPPFLLVTPTLLWTLNLTAARGPGRILTTIFLYGAHARHPPRRLRDPRSARVRRDGEIYRARDTRLNRTVAIKVLRENVATDPQRRERFEREARAISILTHPHICTLHDVGHQDGIDYLVMELLEGQTLAERLARGPSRSTRRWSTPFGSRMRLIRRIDTGSSTAISSRPM